jgi:hypothetical protein
MGLHSLLQGELLFAFTFVSRMSHDHRTYFDLVLMRHHMHQYRNDNLEQRTTPPTCTAVRPSCLHTLGCYWYPTDAQKSKRGVIDVFHVVTELMFRYADV